MNYGGIVDKLIINKQRKHQDRMTTVSLMMQKLHAIIVSLPGTWQKMLENHIESYPFIKVDNVVNGSLSAVQYTREQNPDFMIVDSSIAFNEVIALAHIVKDINPNIQMIVIADTSKQRQRLRHSGIDYAISSCNFETQMDKILIGFKNSLLMDINLEDYKDNI